MSLAGEELCPEDTVPGFFLAIKVTRAPQELAPTFADEGHCDPLPSHPREINGVQAPRPSPSL
jgi:hypothetical protein